MRNLFRNAGFRRLWASAAAIALGDALAQMGLLELFHRLGLNEQVETAKMLFAVATPGLLFSPAAMAYLDRWQRRNVLLASDSFRAFVALALAALVARLALTTGARGLVAVYALLFVMGTVAAFYLPARAAMVPNLVPAELLMPANTLLASTLAVMAIGGRALGGALAELCGPMPGLLANVAAYTVSVLCLRGIQPPPDSARKAGQLAGGWMELRAGLAYLLGHSLAVRLVCIAAVFAFVVGLLVVELVGYATETLGLGTAGVGYLVGAAGVGAAVGMAICARNPAWVKNDWVPPTLLTTAGLALLGLGEKTSVWEAVPLLMFIGAAVAMTAIHVDAKLQQQVDETRRGAVFAARGTLVSLATVVAFWLQFATEVLKETPASVALRWLGTATLTAGALALLTMLSVLRQTRR